MLDDKHCLTSVGAGVAPSSDNLGATITSDDQLCIPITLTEVPCDIQNQDNSGFRYQGGDF
jgi:hypothetical protein